MNWPALVILSFLSPELTAKEPVDTLKVHVVDYAGRSMDHWYRARMIAAGLLEGAGVPTEWKFCRPDSEKPGTRPGAIRGPLSVVVRFLPADVSQRFALDGGTCGVALIGPNGERARLALIDADCVNRTAAGGEDRQIKILGHIMAHEIAHLLLGDATHSTDGIMAAKWDWNHMRRLLRGDLAFTEDESARLRDALQRRALDAVLPGLN